MARQFVGVYNGELVAHTAIINMPMRSDAKREHRSVVLPDYQGIGIGMRFKEAVFDYIRHEGFEGVMFSTTTTPAQYHAQVKSQKWKLMRYGRATVTRNAITKSMANRMKNCSSRERITFTFVYVGCENKERVKYK